MKVSAKKYQIIKKKTFYPLFCLMGLIKVCFLFVLFLLGGGGCVRNFQDCQTMAIFLIE